MNDVIKLLTYVIHNDFEGMLKYFPDGIVCGMNEYKYVDDFEVSFAHGKDPQEIWAAREMMKKFVLTFCIKFLIEQQTNE